MSDRRKFIKGLGLLLGSSFILPIAVKEEEETFLNHHTVRFFDQSGTIIRTERIGTNVENPRNICENIHRRDEVLERLK